MGLFELVTSFRTAIEKAKADGALPDFFRSFPEAQCGNASELLAKYLIEHGFSVRYVSGLYKDRLSHAWLVVDGLIVDITGDQFQNNEKPLNCKTPVYIGKTDLFHRCFEVEEDYDYDGQEILGFGYSGLIQVYRIILDYI